VCVVREAREILIKLAELFKTKTDKELAEKLDISTVRFYGWKKNNTIDLMAIMQVLMDNNIDLNKLLSKDNAVSEPGMDYTALGGDSTIMQLVKTENEVADRRLQIMQLQDELQKNDMNNQDDKDKLRNILIELDELKMQKLKAEAERDVYLKLFKESYSKQ